MFIHSPWRLGSAIASINSLSYIGVWEHGLSPDWQIDPFLNRTHLLYQNIRKLIALRKSCIALYQGGGGTTSSSINTGIYFRQADSSSNVNGQGWLIYSRIYNDMEIIVVLNTNSNDYMNIPTQILIDSKINKDMDGKKYYNALNLDYYGWIGKSNSDGNYYLYVDNPTITVPSDGYVVFIREDQIGSFNDEYQIAFCK